MVLREALTRHGFALAGALTSRFVEQLSGSPTAADVFTFWVLVGMLAAAVALGSPGSTSIDEEVNAARRTTRTGYSKRRALVFPAIAIIAVLSFYMSWETAGRFFFANNAASVLHGTGNPSYADVDARFEQATNLASEVARYWHDRSDLEHGKADANTNPAIILEARQLASNTIKKPSMSTR